MVEKKSVVDFLGLLKDSESLVEELQYKVKETRERTSKSFEERKKRFRF